jgi:hypothetical protein
MRLMPVVDIDHPQAMQGINTMKENLKKDSLFILYILSVIVLAIIYFTIPERKEFFDFQLKWWGEMWQVLKGG